MNPTNLRQEPPALIDPALKVLIVDDEELVRRCLGYAVAIRGWKPFVHDQYADCAALVREHDIDILLTDYRMPAITGLDLIENLRKAGIRIPALIVSGSVYAIDKNRAQRLDVFRILSKPHTVKDLQNALAEAVASGRRARI